MRESDIALFLFVSSIFLLTLTFFDYNLISKTIFGALMCLIAVFLVRKAFPKKEKPIMVEDVYNEP